METIEYYVEGDVDKTPDGRKSLPEVFSDALIVHHGGWLDGGLDGRPVNNKCTGSFLDQLSGKCEQWVVKFPGQLTS